MGVEIAASRAKSLLHHFAFPSLKKSSLAGEFLHHAFSGTLTLDVVIIPIDKATNKQHEYQDEIENKLAHVSSEFCSKCNA